MSGYRLSPAARADLEAIWTFGEEGWGADQAELYIRRIQRAVETVASDPRRGRPCEDIRPGYFRFAVGTHMLFFRRDVDVIEIVRILHQRMDFDGHL
ncbi:MAG TPA: type II toxin-antitoxin system RelE/ParE family toxin [Phenylobacterium sp.]|nr:type II toxin-antitoxin system RelE/ParE family toxin [Phenylobacterium sp.]